MMGFLSWRSAVRGAARPSREARQSVCEARSPTGHAGRGQEEAISVIVQPSVVGDTPEYAGPRALFRPPPAVHTSSSGHGSMSRMTGHGGTPPDVTPLEPGVRGANLLLMFVLEMAVYVGAIVLAMSFSLGLAARIGLAVVFFVVLAMIWGLLGAPRAMAPARGWSRVVLELLWFGAGVAAFALAGQPRLGVALAVLFVVNLTLRWRWRQTPTLP